MKSNSRTALIAGFAFFTGAASYADVALVRDGKPAATLVIPADDWSAEFAAGQLRYRVREITGAEMPIVSGGPGSVPAATGGPGSVPAAADTEVGPPARVFIGRTLEGRDVRFEPEAGVRLQTKALQAAIDRAAANGGGRIVVPAGEWTTASLFFKPGTTLKLEKGATLKGSEKREDYPETTIKIEGTLRKGLAALVNADSVDGFRIEGPGVIDGSGAPYWRDPGLPRPKLLSISRCRGVTLADVTLKNSPFWTCHIQNSSDVLVTGCTILSEKTGGAEPINTDAIDLDGVENVRIRDSYMDVNNDAVALKGGKGPDANDFGRHPENGPCQNVLVENCSFGPLCFAGVTIGSECVVASNVVLRNSRFNGSGATLYLKMRLDTPQLYTDIVATNLSGKARQGLYVKPYLSRSRPEWEKLVIPSVATNVVYDPGPAFTTPNPRVVIPHPACHLHLSAVDGETRANGKNSCSGFLPWCHEMVAERKMVYCSRQRKEKQE